jgi:hypothetical protein
MLCSKDTTYICTIFEDLLAAIAFKLHHKDTHKVAMFAGQQLHGVDISTNSGYANLCSSMRFHHEQIRSGLSV